MKDERIVQDAARWYARLQAPDCSPSDRMAFRCWQQQHRHHASAYARAERLASRFDATLHDPKWAALAEEAFEAARAESRQRRSDWLLPASLAASVLIASATLLFAGLVTDRSVDPFVYATESKAQSLFLADGSSVQLDVNTRIEVRMGESRRDVELLEGRALFDVAHDSARPFSVTAQGSRTTALGTRFQVEHHGEHVLVLLQQGSVAVGPELEDAASSSWSERLQPGEQLTIDSASGAHEKIAVDASVATSWTLGRHVFRATPLDDAVEQINRYAQRKVRLGDPSLAQFTVAGNFIVGDSEQIVAALAAVLPLRVVADGHGEIILFRRYDTDS